jgi:dTDP-4-dehydrorhamnose reductase
MEKLRVLVLGDGLLGSEIVKQTGWDFVSRKATRFNIEGFDRHEAINMDYDIVVNCIANTDTYSNDKGKHWDVNYKFVDNLINFCNRYDIKLVHISTDYIYAGSKHSATEEDVPVHDNNWYSYTKLLSDGAVQLKTKDYLLCRCSHKPKPFPYKKAWDDQYTNTDYVDVIASMIVDAINNNLSGVYNIGTEKKTIYDLALKDNEMMRPIASPVQAPKDITMNTSKYEMAITKSFFSIAIPTYEMNGFGVEFLKHSFEILSTQTFKNFEVVVSDHSLNDDIKDLCEGWKEALHIRYLRNDYKRGGSSPNINNAIKNSEGEWIKLLWQDDFLYDNKSLENTYNHIIANKDKVWFASPCEHSHDGTTFYRPFYPTWTDNIHLGNNRISSPSVITIKNSDNKRYFDENLIWLMDVDYYKGMHDRYGEPSYLKNITVVNRTWPQQLSNTLSQTRKDVEVYKMTQRYGDSK